MNADWNTSFDPWAVSTPVERSVHQDVISSAWDEADIGHSVEDQRDTLEDERPGSVSSDEAASDARKLQEDTADIQLSDSDSEKSNEKAKADLSGPNSARELVARGTAGSSPSQAAAEKFEKTPEIVINSSSAKENSGSDEDSGDEEFADFPTETNSPLTPHAVPSASEPSPASVVPATEVAQEDDDDDFGDFDAAPAASTSVMPEPLGRNPFTNDLQSITSAFEGVYCDLSKYPTSSHSAAPSILTTDHARSVYRAVNTPVEVSPITWKQSNAHRMSLLSLGIPINLDQVLPPPSLPLPPSMIPRSLLSSEAANAQARSEPLTPGAATSASAEGKEYSPASGTWVKRVSLDQASSTRPNVNVQAVIDLINTPDEDTLQMTPVNQLRSLVTDLKQAITDMSSLMAWELQMKDMLITTEAALNDKIANLVNEAERQRKMKGKGLVRNLSKKR